MGRGGFLLVSAALVACGGGTGSGSASQSGGSSGTGDEGTTHASHATTSTSGDSATGEEPTTGGGHSGTQSGSSSEATVTVTATGSTTVDVTATEATSGTTTVDPSVSGTTGTSDGTTSDGTTSTSDGTTGTSDDTTTDAESSTGPDCIPAVEVCNDFDDDCDGNIDNVDVGGDGICDCLNIALVGNQGANPSAEFQDWLVAQGTQVDRISTNPAEVLDKGLLNKYDIIILDYLIRGYTAEEALTTQTWVEAGGGLMAMTGFTNQQFVADRPNSLIKPMGLSYNTSKGFFSGPVKAFAPHPITDTLTSISFYGGLFVDIVEDGVAMNQIIMTLPQGAVGVVQDRGNGRLFIFGDEWIEFDSEWKNIPEIKKFWVQTLAWLGPKDSCLVPQ